MPNRRLLLSNSKPVFGWVFTLVWLGALALGTPSAVASRQPGGLQYRDAILAGFWVCGLGMAAVFLRMPRITVHDDGRDIVVTERWLWTAREHRCPRGEAVVDLVEGTDTDGGQYFRCQLTTPAGHALTIAEGHRRDAVDEARRSVLALLAPEPSGRHAAS